MQLFCRTCFCILQERKFGVLADVVTQCHGTSLSTGARGAGLGLAHGLMDTSPLMQVLTAQAGLVFVSFRVRLFSFL